MCRGIEVYTPPLAGGEKVIQLLETRNQKLETGASHHNCEAPQVLKVIKENVNIV